MMHLRKYFPIIVTVVLLSGGAYAFDDVSIKLVGEWRSMSEHRSIAITRDGSVYSKDSILSGSVALSIVGGGNFEFQNINIQCNYDIAFLKNGDTEWGLVYEKVPKSCPIGGLFSRIDDSNETIKQNVSKNQINSDKNIDIEKVQHDQNKGNTNNSPGNSVSSGSETLIDDSDMPGFAMDGGFAQKRSTPSHKRNKN